MGGRGHLLGAAGLGFVFILVLVELYYALQVEGKIWVPSRPSSFDALGVGLGLAP